MPRVCLAVVTACLLSASLVALPGCKQGTDMLTATFSNMIYGGLSEMGDTSRPAKERRAAAMIEGTEFGGDFGRALQSQLPDEHSARP
jgi:hypothetical protein